MMRNASPNENFLFAKNDLQAMLNNRIKETDSRVSNYEAKSFDNESNDDIFNNIYKQLALHPLTVNFDEARKSHEKVKVKRDLGFNRGIAEVNGTELEIIVPVKGSTILWDYCPSIRDGFFPKASLKRYPDGEFIVIIIAKSDEEPSQSFVKDRDECYAQIKKYLEWQKNDLDKYDKELRVAIKNAIQSRRKSNMAHTDLDQLL